MRIDVIIGNPPFKFIRKMLMSAIDLCKQGCLILPSRAFFGSKTSGNIKIRNAYENYIQKIIMIYPNNIFDDGVYLRVPLVIIYWNKNHNNNSFVVEDRINNVKYTHKDIYNLNQYSYCSAFNKLWTKFDNINNIYDACIDNKILNDDKFYFVFPLFRGHISEENNKLNCDDFNTFMSNKLSYQQPMTVDELKNKIQRHIDVNTFRYIVQFVTKNECINFINSLKLYSIRFALSLNKDSLQIRYMQLMNVPFFDDYSSPITEEFVIKKLNITDDEFAFIKSVIPKYY